MTSTLVKAAVGVAAAAYIDAKHAISNDLRLGRGTTAATIG